MSSQSSSIRLDYHLPSLGSVPLVLHDESARLFHLLDSVGEVERLRRLDHLGIVRAAWDGAHHPRWEYVASIIHLIERCRREAPEVHLAQDLRLGGMTISSSSELLKCWAILLNIGHLAGTFSTERALLFEVWRDRPGARAAYLSAFEDAPLREWADSILRQSSVYQFAQALGFIRLSTIARATGHAPSPELGQAALRAYALPDAKNPRLLALRRVYRNLRRLAFLALDSHYTPAVVRLDLAQILSDPTSLTHLALQDPTTEEDELRGLEQHLHRDIYLGERVLEAIARREANLRQAIRKSLRQTSLHETIELLAIGDLQRDLRSRSDHCLAPADMGRAAVRLLAH
jgi:hypothetical protein